MLFRSLAVVFALVLGVGLVLAGLLADLAVALLAAGLALLAVAVLAEDLAAGLATVLALLAGAGLAATFWRRVCLIWQRVFWRACQSSGRKIIPRAETTGEQNGWEVKQAGGRTFGMQSLRGVAGRAQRSRLACSEVLLSRLQGAIIPRWPFLNRLNAHEVP